MRDTTRLVRDAGGFLAIVTLLSMLLLALLSDDYTVTDRVFFGLFTLISALLGVDIIRERKVMFVVMINGALDAYLSYKGVDEDDD